jgi:aerobic carbon-monoxide dehydrogenase small subunit
VTHLIRVVVNGEPREVEVEGRRLLVQLIRDDLGLTGTHIGCDTSQCGACTVLLDGHAVKSCTVLAAQADSGTITTVEGLAGTTGLSFLQEAFLSEDALQCGYCTPGMLMTAAGLLQQVPRPSDQEVRHALAGNICRCTGYSSILAAVRRAAERNAEAPVTSGPQLPKQVRSPIRRVGKVHRVPRTI